MGVVTDSSGAIVPGAIVELVDNNKGSKQTSLTDRDGTFRFNFLPPGSYTPAVSHSGFRKQVCDVEVRLGPPGTINVALEIVEARTTVKVAEEALLTQAENGDVSTTMYQQQISEVPNTGNDLTYIAPRSVNRPSASRAISGVTFCADLERRKLTWRCSGRFISRKG